MSPAEAKERAEKFLPQVLHDAFAKYLHTFGVEPHGTLPQMAALSELGIISSVAALLLTTHQEAKEQYGPKPCLPHVEGGLIHAFGYCACDVKRAHQEGEDKGREEAAKIMEENCQKLPCCPYGCDGSYHLIPTANQVRKTKSGEGRG